MKRKCDFKNAKRESVVAQKGKTRITIFINTDVLEEFRSPADRGVYRYQTMINEALRFYLGKAPKPVDDTVLRQVLCEDLKHAAHK
jgi:uncharacterized protein (DUF4415 family)